MMNNHQHDGLLPLPHHTYFDIEATAQALGIQPDQIGFSQRRGDLGPADAYTLHGAPLWLAANLMRGAQ